jgi:hypothetical protein
MQFVTEVGRMQEKMEELPGKNWAPGLPGFRELRSLRYASALNPSPGSRPRPTSPDSSTARKKEVRWKSFQAWFWLGALFMIIVPIGFTIWPLRKLYLILKERFDERWEGTVL